MKSQGRKKRLKTKDETTGNSFRISKNEGRDSLESPTISDARIHDKSETDM